MIRSGRVRDKLGGVLGTKLFYFWTFWTFWTSLFFLVSLKKRAYSSPPQEPTRSIGQRFCPRPHTEPYLTRAQTRAYTLKRARFSYGRTPQYMARSSVPHTLVARGTGTPPTGQARASPVQPGTLVLAGHRPRTGHHRWPFARLAWPPDGATTGRLSGGWIGGSTPSTRTTRRERQAAAAVHAKRQGRKRKQFGWLACWAW